LGVAARLRYQPAMAEDLRTGLRGNRLADI